MRPRSRTEIPFRRRRAWSRASAPGSMAGTADRNRAAAVDRSRAAAVGRNRAAAADLAAVGRAAADRAAAVDRALDTIGPTPLLQLEALPAHRERPRSSW